MCKLHLFSKAWFPAGVRQGARLVALSTAIFSATQMVEPAQAQGAPHTVLGASWEGLAQIPGSALRPPDPHGAAGPNGILQVVNTRVAYWTKDGQSVWGPLDFSVFFSVPPVSFLFDPRALFDPVAGRFYVVVLESDDVNQKSFLHIAVSKTATPASGTASDWYFYEIENTRTVGSQIFWGDYPGLGFDGRAIYVTVNLYSFTQGNGDAQITVLDKGAFLSGTTNYHFVYTSGGFSGGFTLQPCTVPGAAGPGNVAYFAETLPGGSSSTVRVWALQDPLGTASLTSTRVAIPDNGGYPPFNGAPQAGTSVTIDTLDGRTQGNAFWNNGSLWFCHTAGGSSGRAKVYYYKVDVANFPGGNPALKEEGSIDGGPGMWTYQPSIGGSIGGDVCLVYTESSSSTYPAIMYSVRTSAETSFETPGVLKTSPGFSNSDRWGDYGSTTVDPADQTFWVTHEWAKSTTRHDWSTWWGNIKPFSPPTITVQPQPANLTILTGMSANYTVTAAGTAPLWYQWFLNGAGIQGATSATYAIASATPAQTGDYSVVVTNNYGAVTSAIVHLTVIPTVPLPFALNNSNLTWTTDAGTPWYGQTNLSHDGSASARSYFIGDAEQTVLSTTINGPGALTFWWKVSSETNADVLTFSDVAGNYSQSFQISGEVDWSLQTVYLPSGPQTLQWRYAKNASVSSGADAAWVDQVAFASGFTQPQIIQQPVGQSTLAASPVTFTVGAVGTPVLSYQWRLNGTDIPGATSTSFTLASPGAGDTGYYSVRVSSPYGSALSADAYLGVVPLVVGGDNSLGQINVSALATNAVAISAGAWHSLVLREDGTVLAWGENYDGQCNVPAQLTDAVGIAAGGYHSLALNRDGTVTGWGANYSGQAMPPAGLSNVVALAAGTWHSLALLANGKVVAWGDNTAGQSLVPASLANVVAIAAGGSHSLALRADGTVVAWGENTDAGGGFAGQSTVPFGLLNVVAIAAGDYHSLAIKSDGTVVAWGDNSQGQSQPPAGLTNALAAAGGAGHTVALNLDTTAEAWGNDWNHQCDLPALLTNVVAVAAGNSHTLLLSGDRYAPPRLLRARRAGNRFSAVVRTYYGYNYALEYRNSLSVGTWTALSVVRGRGGLQVLTDSSASGPQRFYRVRQW